MNTRWIIRIAVLLSVLLIGAFADAQNASKGGGSAPSGGKSVGNNSGGSRGGSNAPAPRSGGAAAGSNNSNGGTTSSSGGTTSNRGGTAPSGGSATPNVGTPNRPIGTVLQPGGSVITRTPRPPMGPIANPPANGNGRTGVTNPPADDGQIGDGRDGRGRNRHRRHDRNNNVPVYVLPPTYGGWAPYNWWYNGNSGWFGGGYGNNDDYGDRLSDGTYDRPYDEGYDRVAPRPAPTEPSAALEQARAENALAGMPAYNQAMVEYKAAQQAYEDALARVLEKLRQSPEYRKLAEERDRLDERVEAVQASARTTGDVLPAAQQKLNVSSRVTKMEQDAISADPQASAAKARMVAANEKLTALRKQQQAVGTR